MEMVGASATGDPQRAGELLGQIAESRPTGDMFPVCCGVASVGQQLMVKMTGGMMPAGHYWGLVSQPGETPETSFASRFLVAYANGDVDMCRALYGAAATAPGYALADSVVALVVYVGMLAKQSAGSSPG